MKKIIFINLFLFTFSFLYIGKSSAVEFDVRLYDATFDQVKPVANYDAIEELESYNGPGAYAASSLINRLGKDRPDPQYEEVVEVNNAIPEICSCESPETGAVYQQYVAECVEKDCCKSQCEDELKRVFNIK